MGWMSVTRMFLLPHKLLLSAQDHQLLPIVPRCTAKEVSESSLGKQYVSDPCAIVAHSVWLVSDSAGALFWPVGWTLTPNCPLFWPVGWTLTPNCPLVMSPLSTWLCYRCGTNPNNVIFTFQKLSFFSSTPSFLSPSLSPPSYLICLPLPPSPSSFFSLPLSSPPSPPLPPLPPFPFLPFLLLGWCSVQCSTIRDVNR